MARSMPNLFLQPSKSRECLQAETGPMEDMQYEAQLNINGASKSVARSYSVSITYGDS
jgi:hypothetical protein